MDRFTHEDLRALTHENHAPCVSLFMPTHRTGREIREDAIRCKNLIKQAEDRLSAANVSSSVVQQLLEPIRELQADGDFWQHQADGLALFSSASRLRHYRVPRTLEELCIVGSQFHVKPIMPVLQNDGRFYLLAVSLNKLRLFRGTHFSVTELEHEALPSNLADALNIDEYMRSLQQHSVTSPRGVGGRGDTAMFHGQGGSDMDVKKKDEIRQYFLRIDGGLKELFGEERSPLVFAGVEYLFPIFRDACSYRHLVEEPVTGNPDVLNAQQLHDKAWKVIEPHFRQREQAALDRYHDRKAGDLATHQLFEILAAARRGQIELLFVACDEHVWGAVDENGGITKQSNEPEVDTSDLLDHAAVDTLMHGGTVFALERDRMPDNRQIAAVYRYAN